MAKFDSNREKKTTVVSMALWRFNIPLTSPIEILRIFAGKYS
jgi:hypothetical protein